MMFSLSLSRIDVTCLRYARRWHNPDRNRTVVVSLKLSFARSPPKLRDYRCISIESRRWSSTTVLTRSRCLDSLRLYDFSLYHPFSKRPILTQPVDNRGTTSSNAPSPPSHTTPWKFQCPFFHGHWVILGFRSGWNWSYVVPVSFFWSLPCSVVILQKTSFNQKR